MSLTPRLLRGECGPCLQRSLRPLRCGRTGTLEIERGIGWAIGLEVLRRRPFRLGLAVVRPELVGRAVRELPGAWVLSLPPWPDDEAARSHRSGAGRRGLRSGPRRRAAAAQPARLRGQPYSTGTPAARAPPTTRHPTSTATSVPSWLHASPNHNPFISVTTWVSGIQRLMACTFCR